MSIDYCLLSTDYCPPISGYSSHADQKGLLDWVQAMGDLPGEIRLVHGEYAAKQGLKLALRERGMDKQGIVRRDF